MIRTLKRLTYAGALLVGGVASAQAAGGQAGGAQPGAAQPAQPGAAQPAQPGAAQPAQPGAPQQGVKSVVGTVEGMSGNTLTLKNKLNETHQFALSSSTKYQQKGGKTISKDQIREGDEVRAAFRTDPQGKLHATKIIKMSSGAGGAAKGGGGAQSGGGSQSGGSQQ